MHTTQFIVGGRSSQTGFDDSVQGNLDFRDHGDLVTVESGLVGIDFLANGQEVFFRHRS